MTAFARKVLNGLPAPTIGRRRRTTTRSLQRVRRTTPTRPAARSTSQVSPRAVGVRPRTASATSTSSTTRRCRCPRAAAATATTYVDEQAVRVRRHLGADGHVAARGPLRLVATPPAGKNPLALGTARRARRVRHHRPADRSARRRRPADAAHHRLLRPRPPGDQPAVAVPDGVQPEGELHVA